MAWKFDSLTSDVVWVTSLEMTPVVDGSIDLGIGDLLIDIGLREDGSSVLDQGQRVIDGSI